MGIFHHATENIIKHMHAHTHMCIHRAGGTSPVGQVLAGPIFRQVLEKKTQ